MDIESIVSQFNQGLTLQNIADKNGVAKSTIQRNISKHSYTLNKKTGQCEKHDINMPCDNGNMDNLNIGIIGNNKTLKTDINKTGETCNNEIMGTCNNETMEHVNDIGGIKSMKKHKMISRTFNISERLDKAIKIKAVMEGKKAFEVINELLEKGIEEKYLDM